MKKTLKTTKKLLIGAFALTLSLGCITAVGAPKASADGTYTTDSFKVAGASIRYTAPEGIRFETWISASEYEKIVAVDSTPTFGTLIVPVSLVSAEEVESKLVLENVGTGEGQVDALPYAFTESYVFDTTDEKTGVAQKAVRAVLDTIPANFHNTELWARSYIEVNGIYHYTKAISRSILYVAQKAYYDTETTPAQQTKLMDTYIEPEVTNDAQIDYTVERYLQNADGSYNATASETEKKKATFNSTVAAATGDYTDANGVIYEAIAGEDGIVWADGSLVMAQKYVRKIGSVVGNIKSNFAYNEDGTVTTAMAYSLSRTDNLNAVYTCNSYSANENFIRLDFTGKNYPGQILFGVTTDVSSTRSNMKYFGIDIDLNYYGSAGFVLNCDSLAVEGQTGMNTGTTVSALSYSKNFNIATAGYEKEFVLLAGLEQSYNKPIYLKYELYEKTGEGILELVEQNTFHYSASNTAPNTQATGKIMVVADCKNTIDTVVTMHRPTTLEAQKDALRKEFTVKYNDTWSKYDTNTNVSTDLTTGISTVVIGQNLSNTSIQAGYVITNDEYSYDNNFVRIEFTGAGPGRILFGVDNESSHAGVSDMSNLIGFGLAMDVGGDGPYYYLKPNATTEAMIAKATNAGSKTNYDKFASGTDYVLIAGTAKGDVSDSTYKTKLVWKLYTKADKTLTLIDEGEYSRSWTEIPYVGTGKILISGEANWKLNPTRNFTVTSPTTLENVMTALSNDYTISAASATAVSVNYSGSQKQISALGYNGYPSTTLSTTEQQALVEAYAESGMTDLYIQSVLYDGTSGRLTQLKSALDVCAAAGMKNNVIVVDERIANLSAQTASLLGTDSD